jgi:hypothetical protein
MMSTIKRMKMRLDQIKYRKKPTTQILSPHLLDPYRLSTAKDTIGLSSYKNNLN